MACKLVGWELSRPKTERVLLPEVEQSTLPSGDGVTAIRANIQHLHRRILGEDLSPSDPEIERTYELFRSTYEELKTAGKEELDYECQGRWNRLTGTELPQAQRIDRDKQFTVRAWMAVLAYLFSDFGFLHG
jgi:hypothetical protein